MTYRCGVGPGIPGIAPGAPHVRCDADGCDAQYEAKEGRGGGPPAWLRNNKAPPGWRLMRGGDKRRDFCPKHKAT